MPPPPFLLADTCFAEGLGMTEALGSAFDNFRGYVRFMDGPVHNVVGGHVQRVICCVRGHEQYNVEVKGDAAQVEDLAQAPRGTHAHALLAAAVAATSALARRLLNWAISSTRRDDDDR